MFNENLRRLQVKGFLELVKVFANNTFGNRNIVDAAHLSPITKYDKKNAETRSRLWNSSVREQQWSKMEIFGWENCRFIYFVASILHKN